MDKGVIWIEFLLVILYIIWDLILSLNECFQSNSRPSLPIQVQNKTKQVQSVNNKENMEFKEKKI